MQLKEWGVIFERGADFKGGEEAQPLRRSTQRMYVVMTHEREGRRSRTSPVVSQVLVGSKLRVIYAGGSVVRAVSTTAKLFLVLLVVTRTCARCVVREAFRDSPSRSSPAPTTLSLVVQQSGYMPLLCPTNRWTAAFSKVWGRCKHVRHACRCFKFECRTAEYAAAPSSCTAMISCLLGWDQRVTSLVNFVVDPFVRI